MSEGSLPGNIGDTAVPGAAVDPSEFNLRYYGWRVVLAACLGVMAGFGSLFVYTFSVFVKPLSAEFGWNREAISSGFAIAAVTLGLISPLLGRLIDRYGPRRIILPCMTIYVCAIVSLSLLGSGVWQFYVSCFVLGLVGNGAAHLAYSRSISTWFHRRLGTALAFVMVGAGLGAMILPVIAQSVISHAGWRAAYVSLGGLALLLGLPLSWLFIRERGATAHRSGSVAFEGVPWQRGVRSSAFWIITAILFVSSISMNGAITHLSALLTDRGITARDARYAHRYSVDRACWEESSWDGCSTGFSRRMLHSESICSPQPAYFCWRAQATSRQDASQLLSSGSAPAEKPRTHHTC